jgi:Domain of unknown function (DUF4160)
MMPQAIAPIDGYAVLVYTRDEHPPAHVHVRKDRGFIKILLGKDSVEYHSCKGARASGRVKNRALEIVSENLDACWAMGKEYHEQL